MKENLINERKKKDIYHYRTATTTLKKFLMLSFS